MFFVFIIVKFPVSNPQDQYPVSHHIDQVVAVMMMML